MIVRNLEFNMPGDRHFTRIDILEIKIQIGKKLGSHKAQQYFGLLNSYFSLKLAKSEFDKLCVASIGRENLCLHNRLITSILKNALFSKTPPRKGNKVDNDKVANGYKRSCLQSLCGDVLPPSPRKGRTVGFRDRKVKDRPSPLGPHGKPDAVAASKDLGQKTIEQQSATELLSLGSRPVEVTSVEDGEEVDQAAISPGIHSRSPVTPPFGIPWNGKGYRKVLSSLSPSIQAETCNENGELPDTGSLKKRIEQKLEKEDMRVSIECVNLLNSGLDTFLKRLIKPSLELASSRGNKGHNVGIIGSDNLVTQVDFGSGHHLSNLMPPEASVHSTMLDFRSAMEIDPQLLGEDWPVQLEKVCFRVSESSD